MQQLDTLIRGIRTHEREFRALGIEKLWIFGSYARGEQRPSSDLDILVRFRDDHHKGAYFQMGEVKYTLEKEFGLVVDVQLEDKTTQRSNIDAERIEVL